MVSQSRTINFPSLNSFCEVVRCGGISAAADSIGIAKSAVSKHIRQLEAHLNIQLFERSPRGAKLTAAGERLLPQIESLLAEVERLAEAARNENADPSGLVRIATTPEFGGLLARKFLPLVAGAYPGITLAIRPSYGLEDMQDPSIDLAFRIGSFGDDRLVVRELGSFHRILVASPAYLAANPVSDIADLRAARCLIFSGERSNSTWRLQRGKSGVRQEEIDVSGPIAMHSFTAIMELAREGHGIGFVPDFLTYTPIRAGELTRCLEPWHSKPVPVFLSYRPGSQKISRVKATIELASQKVPALLGHGN